MKQSLEKHIIDIEPLLQKFGSACIDAFDPEKTQLIGIHRGGVWLAHWLQQHLGIQRPVGALDISFYRDDFSARGLQPQVRPSDIPFPVDHADIALIDDVILSGRTIRAALNEIFDFGRPNRIRFACLIDLGRNELPIRPDICATTMQLAGNERLELTGPKPLGLVRVHNKEQLPA